MTKKFLVQLTVVIGDVRTDVHTLVADAETSEEAGVFAICVEAFDAVNFSSNDTALTHTEEVGYVVRRITLVTDMDYRTLGRFFTTFHYDPEMITSMIDSKEGFPPCLLD